MHAGRMPFTVVTLVTWERTSSLCPPLSDNSAVRPFRPVTRRLNGEFVAQRWAQWVPSRSGVSCDRRGMEAEPS